MSEMNGNNNQSLVLEGMYKGIVGKIDEIRGVKSERAVESLLKRGLVEERGRGSGLGRPILYGTTPLFLERFGIGSLKELPVIDDIVKDWEEGAESSQQMSMNV